MVSGMSSGELGVSGYPGDPRSASRPSSYPGALPFDCVSRQARGPEQRRRASRSAHDEARSGGRTSAGEVPSVHAVLSGTESRNMYGVPGIPTSPLTILRKVF